jgi:predicted nucleic acid-binding protein
MAKVQIVVTDTNVLINLIHIGCLLILGSLAQFEFVVPDEVVAEILKEEQAVALQAAIDAKHLSREAFQDTEELTTFAALASFLGKGESACLALAQQRGWWVASDEGGAFRREAQQRLGPGRLINTPGLLLSAIRAGVLTVDEADQAKAVLEQHRFRVRFKSFRDLLES